MFPHCDIISFLLCYAKGINAYNIWYGVQAD